ncbi:MULTISPECIES: p-hydroxycinnamoyl CoA hydratase/lyase [unclassified Variovorax]
MNDVLYSQRSFVDVEMEGQIAWVSINRPEKKNAISPAVAAQMIQTLEKLEADDRCGVVVITGTGDSFHAGMDLKDFFRVTDGMSESARQKIYRMNAAWQWRQLMHYPKPTIAMVNGWCFGGGFCPLISCDLAIAADDAIFGVSEINWGILPAGNVTKALSVVMPHRDAMYYIMTGETFDGKRAAQMRIVNESVARDQLRDRTRQLANVLLQKNPMTLRAAKDAFRRVRDMSWEDANDYLFAKLDQARLLDPEGARAKGIKQFVDEKTYKPGLGSFDRSR